MPKLNPNFDQPTGQAVETDGQAMESLEPGMEVSPERTLSEKEIKLKTRYLRSVSRSSDTPKARELDRRLVDITNFLASGKNKKLPGYEARLRGQQTRLAEIEAELKQLVPDAAIFIPEATPSSPEVPSAAETQTPTADAVPGSAEAKTLTPTVGEGVVEPEISAGAKPEPTPETAPSEETEGAIKTKILSGLQELNKLIGTSGRYSDPRIEELMREMLRIHKLIKSPTKEQKADYLDILKDAEKRILDIESEVKEILSTPGERARTPENEPKSITPEQAGRELDQIGEQIRDLFARGSVGERDRKIDDVPALKTELEAVALRLKKLKATPLVGEFPDDASKLLHEEALIGFTGDITNSRAILQRTIDRGEQTATATPPDSGTTEPTAESTNANTSYISPEVTISRRKPLEIPFLDQSATAPAENNPATDAKRGFWTRLFGGKSNESPVVAPEQKEAEREKPVLKVLSAEQAEALASRLDVARASLAEARKGKHKKEWRKAIKSNKGAETLFDIPELKPGAGDLEDAEKQERFIQKATELLGLSKETALAIYRERVLSAEYNRDKDSLGKATYTDKTGEISKRYRDTHGPDFDSWSAEDKAALEQELRSVSADLYQVMVIGESQKFRALEGQGWMGKAWENHGKSTLRYLREHRKARILVTTGLMTGFYFTTGLGLGALALYATGRVAGAFLAGSAATAANEGYGKLGGKAIDKAMTWAGNKMFVDPREKELMERARAFQGEASREDEIYQKISKWMEVGKGVTTAATLAPRLMVMLGVGYLTGRGTSYAFDHLGGLWGGGVDVSTVGGKITPEPGTKGGSTLVENQRGASTASQPTGVDTPGRASNGNMPGTMPAENNPRVTVTEPKVGTVRAPESIDIQKGDSFWKLEQEHLRQQIHSLTPEELKAKFGLTVDDLDDEAKINHAVDARTLELLKEQGYVKPDGSEVRIRLEPGSKAVFDADGKIKIESGHTYEWSPKSNLPEEASGPAGINPAEIHELGQSVPAELPPTLEGTPVGIGETSPLANEYVEPYQMPTGYNQMEAAISKGLDRYMGGIGEHLLSNAERADVRYFVTQFIHEHPGPFSLEHGAPNLSPGLRTDTIEDLMQNKSFMQDAVAYSKECSLLENQRGLFRFSPSELRSPEYLSLRKVRVDEFLKNLPEQHGNPENLVGHTAKFKLPSGEKINISLNKGYGVLANHMDMNQRFAGGDKIGRMSVSEFIKAYEKP